MEAYEGQGMAVIDLIWAFLYLETNEHIIMVLKGKPVEMMAMVDLRLNRKYVMTDHKGQSVMYMKIHKALHGLLRSALLLYRKLVKDLEQYGFVLNLYDPCVTSTMIDRHQMTIS